MPYPPPAHKGRRPYRSPQRQEQARQTRRRILAAARDEFLQSGYAATTMRSVAAAAGVAVPTVESAFGTKPQLLKEAIDVAIAGDDEPVPVLDREWAERAQAAPTVAAFLVVVGRVFVDAAQRAAGLVLVALESAGADPIIGGLADQLRSQRAETAAWIAEGVAARSALRPGIDRQQAVDTVWLLMDPAVFCRLTIDRGWSAPRFERWFNESVALLLAADAGMVAPDDRSKDR